MKLKTFLLSTICFFEFFLAAEVEQSVIPQIEYYEELENLPKAKFSQTQFREIADLLSHKDAKLRVATFNMLFPIYDDQLDPINPWPQRLPRVVEVIKDMDADLIGSQELFKNQVDDLISAIGDVYGFYAYPLENYKMPGIFYRKDRFEIVESKSWEMPLGESTKHDMLTLLILKDLRTNQLLAYFNTHLAFSQIDKRDAQTRFIAETVESYAGKYPVIFTGDLNTFPARPDLQKLPFFDGDYILRLLTRNSLRDSIDLSLLGHLGPISSFTNAEDDIQPFEGKGTPGVILDHILVSKEFAVLIHAVQSATVDGHFPSDHMPVIADLINLH